MFGLPGQTVNQALSDLETAIDHAPQHISWYQLTIEPNTVFYSKPPVLPEEDQIWEMQERGQELLAQHGYPQYEISAYAKPEHQCLHNLNYWQFGDYLGIGAGAHSKLTNVADGSITRSARHRIPERYIELAGNAAAVSDKRELNKDDLKLEFMMNVLRLKEGVHPSMFLQRTGLPVSDIQSQLHSAEDNGLLEWNITTLKPTEKGHRYLNDLLQYFMHDNNKMAMQKL
jgi:oxygen-independent coproporphyrinogen-3 oxidase